MENTPNFYSNPAFCQQSEFYQKTVSPQRSTRRSPVGAQTPHRPRPEEECYEQEFYEEVLVDDTGLITQKKIVVVAQDNEGKQYIQQDKKRATAVRYAAPLARRESIKSLDVRKARYEYIPMTEQSPTKSVEDKVHRYEVIQSEESSYRTKNGRYALVPVEDLPQVMSQPRYEYIQDTSPRKLNSTYAYIDNSPQKTANRYEYIENHPPRGNPIATQKLHELLSTPRKTPARVRCADVAPPPPPPKTPSRKAQQKLNYTIASRQFEPDKRHTAIVAPICSSPVQSVYSDTTQSKSDSWSGRRPPVQATLAVAAIMMCLCGFVSTGLCLYMISILGRLYYLDFGIVAGFMCLVLGMLGFRSRNCYWLPNRNYITGYILLSVFSLLTCGGLLVLLVRQPKPGSPLADIMSGAVCGVSVLSLFFATTGVVASYCCKVPPPDNRVQHCAQGFTV